MEISRKIVIPFDGHGGSDGRCGMRVASTQEAPLIAMCVQEEDYTGVSVTNAIELIIPIFDKMIRGGEFGKKFADIYRGLVSGLESKLSPAQKMRKFINIVSGSKNTNTAVYELMECGKLVWLEAYPPNTGILGSIPSVQRVRLSDGGGPIWSNIIQNSVLKEKYGITFDDVFGS